MQKSHGWRLVSKTMVLSSIEAGTQPFPYLSMAKGTGAWVICCCQSSLWWKLSHRQFDALLHWWSELLPTSIATKKSAAPLTGIHKPPTCCSAWIVHQVMHSSSVNYGSLSIQELLSSLRSVCMLLLLLFKSLLSLSLFSAVLLFPFLLSFLLFVRIWNLYNIYQITSQSDANPRPHTSHRIIHLHVVEDHVQE